MNLCKVGNQTSSQDPQAVNSRVFVGNLNTFQVNKVDVEKTFQRYGRIVGISMHKGYAFVQFANPFDARSACLGEDGRSIAGQVIDVNMVSEPKPHIGKLKANQATKKNGTSCEDADASLEDSIVSQTTASRKRSRSDDDHVTEANGALDLKSLKTYELSDILICGNCKEMFSNISDMVDHKRNYCKLRFACKCGPMSATRAADEAQLRLQQERPPVHDRAATGGGSSVSLLCSSCQQSFTDPWHLLVHVQTTHSVDIYDTMPTQRPAAK